MCVHSLIDTNRIDASLVWWIYTPFPYYSHTDHTHSLFTCSISSFLFLAVLFSLTFVLMPMNYSYSPSVYLFARAFDAELACLASSLLRPVRLPSSGPTLGVANRNSRVVLPSWIRIESVVVVVARFHLESGESSTPFPLLFSRVSSSLRLSPFGSQMSSFSCRWLPIGIGTDETNPSTHQQKKEKKEIQRERGGDTIWKSKGLRDVKGGGSRLNKQNQAQERKAIRKKSNAAQQLVNQDRFDNCYLVLSFSIAVNVAFFTTQFYLRNLLYIFKKIRCSRSLRRTKKDRPQKCHVFWVATH